MKRHILFYLCSTIILTFFIFSSGAFAINDPLSDPYDTRGFDQNRLTVSIADFEHIDPYSGGLTLSFEDLHVPGDAGLDLIIQRVYNSRVLCGVYVTDAVTNKSTCLTVNEDSWVGRGWNIHFGRLQINANTYTIELPDGSKHEAYPIPSSPKKKTKEYWIVESQLVNNSTIYILTFTDGKKIYFESRNGGYRATKIEDIFGNTISISYYGPTPPSYQKEYEGAIKTVTVKGANEIVGRTFNFVLTPTIIGGRYRLSKITGSCDPDVPGNTAATCKTYDYLSYVDPNRNASYNDTALLQNVISNDGGKWTFAYDTTKPQPTYPARFDIKTVTTPQNGVIDYSYQFTLGPTPPIGYMPVSNKTAHYYNYNDSVVDPRTGTWEFKYFQGTNMEETHVTDSCGRLTKYRHFTPLSVANGSIWKTGLLISKEVANEEKISYDWIQSSDYISTDPLIGYNGRDYFIYVSYLSKQTLSRGGYTYSTSYGNFDNFGNPKLITETGAGNKSRVRTIASYWNNIARNIVKGKPDYETISGSFPGSYNIDYVYNPTTGALETINKYGVTTNYAYYPDGNLKTVTDANNNVTTYEWKYGRFSKRTHNPLDKAAFSINRDIGPMGVVNYIVDGNARTTTYKYDPELRLTDIIYPTVSLAFAGTPVQPNQSKIDYFLNSSAALPYKKEDRGGFTTTTTFDRFGRIRETSNSRGVVESAVSGGLVCLDNWKQFLSDKLLCLMPLPASLVV